MARNYIDEAAERLTSGAHDDFISFAEQHLKIQTKSGDFIPFKLNKSQLLREGLISEMEAKGVPVRVWEAKARQLGCSTHVQGRMFWRCITNNDETALVAAHAEPSVRSIFTKCKIFYDYLPVELKPLTRYNNVYELDFRSPSGGAGLRSRLVVMTAKSTDDARGSTPRQVHLSEVAFYKQPEKFFLATLQGVPDEPGTMIYSESTCNGSGDFNHSMYLNANVWWDEIPPWMTLKKKHPGSTDSTWYALFTPWFLMEEYSRKLLVEEGEFRSTLNSEERELEAMFGDWITLENLQWRRETIVSKCGNSVERFHQEYPSTDSEAFSTSGSPVFDQELVWKMVMSEGCSCKICARKIRVNEDNACPEHLWYEIEDVSGNEPGRVRMFSSYEPELLETLPGQGRLSVWKKANRRRKYVVSVDVSRGAASKDWNHLVVMDVASMEQVAEWRGKCELDELCEVSLMLALYYNNATLAPEITGLGSGLVAMLGQTRYWNIYRRQSVDTIGLNSATLGWHTNKKTKPALVGMMQKALKDGYIKIRSQTVLAEMVAFRQMVVDTPGGAEGMTKMKAPPGKHDDAIMSAMICNAVAHQHPGSGADVRKDGPAAAPGDHNKWTDEDWETYENWTKKARRRLHKTL